MHWHNCTDCGHLFNEFELPQPGEHEGYRHCRACGLTDGAWVGEEMTALRADAYGLAPNQRCEMVDSSTWRVHTHLCPDVLATGRSNCEFGGAA